MLVVIESLVSQLTKQGELLVVTLGSRDPGRCYTGASLPSPGCGTLGTSLPPGACSLICEMEILPFASHR